MRMSGLHRNLVEKTSSDTRNPSPVTRRNSPETKRSVSEGKKKSPQNFSTFD